MNAYLPWAIWWTKATGVQRFNREKAIVVPWAADGSGQSTAEAEELLAVFGKLQEMLEAIPDSL